MHFRIIIKIYLILLKMLTKNYDLTTFRREITQKLSGKLFMGKYVFVAKYTLVQGGPAPYLTRYWVLTVRVTAWTTVTRQQLRTSVRTPPSWSHSLTWRDIRNIWGPLYQLWLATVHIMSCWWCLPQLGSWGWLKVSWMLIKTRMLFNFVMKWLE